MNSDANINTSRCPPEVVMIMMKKTIESVEKAGFEKCYLNIHGYNKFNTNPFLLKRIVMNNEKNYKLILG